MGRPADFRFRIPSENITRKPERQSFMFFYCACYLASCNFDPEKQTYRRKFE